MKLSGKRLFIISTGRVIGLIAAIAAKTDEARPKLAGTIYNVAQMVEQTKGCALPLVVDVRDDAQAKNAAEQAVSTFGGSNNALAITLMRPSDIISKRVDPSQQIGARGTFSTSRAGSPCMRCCANARDLALPLEMRSGWFVAHLPCAIEVRHIDGDVRA